MFEDGLEFECISKSQAEHLKYCININTIKTKLRNLRRKRALKNFDYMELLSICADIVTKGLPEELLEQAGNLLKEKSKNQDILGKLDSIIRFKQEFSRNGVNKPSPLRQSYVCSDLDDSDIE